MLVTLIAVCFVLGYMLGFLHREMQDAANRAAAGSAGRFVQYEVVPMGEPVGVLAGLPVYESVRARMLVRGQEKGVTVLHYAGAAPQRQGVPLAPEPHVNGRHTLTLLHGGALYAGDAPPRVKTGAR